MYLKAIELQGFKSFPDKTVLQFGKGITAVVGPNGSGKSNLSDAMRWVLGEQSTKTLRGSKMEDVIFSGTDSRRAVGFAEVSLVLDNSDAALANPEKEVRVTRRYFRSGESEYKINGKDARLRDIHELFMDTGLGRDGYSMVSQGKIETLVSAKSGERRDMLEEAAGISHYRYRRTEALRRLDQAEENLLRLRDIVTELESRVGPLKTQSEKAQKFLEYSGEKKTLEIGLWLHNIDKTREGLRDHEKKLAVANAQYEEACSALEGLTGAIDGALEKTREITAAIDEERRAGASLEERTTALEGQMAVLQANIGHNDETIERIEREKAETNDETADVAKQIDEARAAIAALHEKEAAAKAELDSFTGEMNELSDRGSESARRSGELSDEVSRLSLQIADARVTASTSASSAEELDKRVAALDEAAANREPILQELEKELAEAEKALAAIDERAAELQNSLTGLEMLAAKRTEKLEKLQAEEAQMQNDLALKQQRLTVLSDLEKNMEGYQGSVRAVMAEVRHGTLTGIHAPVSQLISVNDEYALAIETALGAQLQHVVTDTEQDAKRAIGFLKRSNAGRATYLPLTSVKGRLLDEKNLDACDGYVNIASRLVTADGKYRGVIESLLGRTVVAEDLDAAIAISKKYGYRFKTVTLDGQVVNAGGSMTGGAKLRDAGILSRGNEIEKLKATCAELEEKRKAFSATVQSARESCAGAAAELDGCRAEIASLGEDRVRAESGPTLKQGQLAAVRTGQEESARETADLLARAAGDRDAAAAAEATLTALRADLEKAESAAAALTGDRESITARREELTARAGELNLAIATARKEREGKEEEIARLEGRGEGHKTKIDQLDAEIAELQKANDALANSIADLQKQKDEAGEENKASAERVAALVAEREEYEKQTAGLRVKERDKTDEREKLSGETARLTERKDRKEKELETLTNKLYEEYELTRREAEELNIELGEIGVATKRLSELKGKIRALGSVNVSAIEEYKEVSERYTFLHNQITDVEKSKAELTKLIRELTDKMGVRFKEQFEKINQCFGQTFSELFGGGKAALVLSDESDVLESDIEIKVQPPGKNVQNITLLSGGEKGLSAIALLFAILKVSPSPFVIFDEVEAALDDVNVTRYAAYVRTMVDNTQFILITHRRGTMEEADMLYGVTMQEKGVSKLLELKTAEMASRFDLT